MQTNRVSPVSYQAQIPKRLQERMFYEANKKGNNYCNLFFNQSKNFKEWGCDEATSLALFETRTSDGVQRTLGLVSNAAAPLKKVLLPMKETILESFLALTEKDIVKAENNLLKYI